jgi:hypothetical protein
MIDKPVTAVPNEDRSIKLYFDFDDDQVLYPEGDFDIRGGICWPVTFKKDGQVDSQGYILLAGMNLNNGVITIFEQQSFLVVEPIINQENMQIDYPGISNFINNAHSNYFCRKFYWHQNFELTKKWRLDVLRSRAIEPKPVLTEVPWGDDRDADHLIWTLVKMKKLRHDLKADLASQLEDVKLKPKGIRDILPAVRALQCALMGFQRYPLRRRG